MRRTRAWSFAFAWWVVVLLPAGASAQSSMGEVGGIIQDEQGGLLPGVSLSLRHDASGVVRSAVTEQDGRYRFPGLPPGVYTLRAELGGFSVQEVTGIEMTVGLSFRRDFTLRVESLREAITVHAQAPVVDTTKAEVSGVVTQRQIESLPINSRQYLSLALLMPGTSLDSTRPYFPTVNVGGSMTFNSTANVVDGVINNFAEDGEPRQNLPQDAVEEFKVSSGQFKAELGLATGGAVQVVTRSGTNIVHGNLFEYFRNKALNARNFFETAKPEYQRDQYGGSLGGPLRRDRLHYFGAVERTSVEEFFTVNTGLPQYYGSLEGTFKKPFHRNLYFGRVDWQISNSQTGFARYAHEDEKSTCGGCGGTAAANAGFDQETPRRSLVVGHTWIRGSRQLNDLRFQYARAGYYIAPAGTEISRDIGSFSPDRISRQVIALRFPSLTWGSSFDEVGPESRWELKDTYAITMDRHEVRAGIDISYMPYTEQVANNYRGTYSFSRDQFFDPDVPSSVASLTGATSFSAQLPPISTSRPTKYYVGFVQDDWKPRRDLTLSLGLRYERLYGCCNEDLDPSIFPINIPYIDVSKRGDRNNFGPRVGVAWDARHDGTTVVRAGWGMYYGHVRILQNLNEFRNYKRFLVNISNPAYPDPYGGKDPLTYVSTAPANITVVANDYVQPYSHQFSAGLSRQLPWALALHVDGLYTRTHHDRKILDINARDPVTRTRPNPTFGRVDRNQSTGEVRYRALYTRVERRFLNRTQFTMSYSYVNSRDNNVGIRYLDPFDGTLDWGPSNGERRHALVASGSVLLPWEITAGALWTLRSQLPWSATAGRDLNGDGFNTDLVPRLSRNTGSRNLDLNAVNAWRAANGRTPIDANEIESSGINLVDVRVAKRVPLSRRFTAELAVQVFNLFNQTNLQDQYGGGRIGNALSDRFGRIQTARPARQGEVAARLTW